MNRAAGLRGLCRAETAMQIEPRPAPPQLRNSQSINVKHPSAGQSRTWSAVESGATLFVGYLCAVLFYQIVWPLFGYEVHVADSAAVALLMFPVNYVRQYAGQSLEVEGDSGHGICCDSMAGLE